MNSSPAAPSRQLLSVADFKAWQRVNAAAHAKNEARVAAEFIDFVLRDVLLHIDSSGLQAACDQAWLNRGRHFPQPHRQAAYDALVAIDWLGEDSEASQ